MLIVNDASYCSRLRFLNDLNARHRQRNDYTINETLFKAGSIAVVKSMSAFHFISKIRNTYNENMIKKISIYKNSIWLLAPV